MAAPLPAELEPLLRQSLLSFFSGAEAEAFDAGAPEERAHRLSTFLTGQARTIQEAAEPRRVLRVLVTGCFDLMHVGHYNALRQAKAAFHGEVVLVAGVHSDKAILHAKGAPTIMTHEERVQVVRACRWVDEVAEQLDYAVPLSLLERLNCDVAVHGDDLPVVSNGVGLFDELRAAGKLKIVKRTEGTSTTMLIGRLMSMSKEHLMKANNHEGALPVLVSSAAAATLGPSETPIWMLLPTMSRIALFYGEPRRRLADATKVVYCPGEWDLFHCGHVPFLERVSALGDFVLVGCLSDELIHKKKGKNYPVQTLHERAMNLLACRLVDDVVLGPTWSVTQDLLTTMNVQVVVTGSNNMYVNPVALEDDVFGLGDPFEVPRELGILAIVDSGSHMTMDVLAERTLKNAQVYGERQVHKKKAESEYNDAKVFVAES